MCTHACVCVLKGGVVLFKKKRKKRKSGVCQGELHVHKCLKTHISRGKTRLSIYTHTHVSRRGMYIVEIDSYTQTHTNGKPACR